MRRTMLLFCALMQSLASCAVAAASFTYAGHLDDGGRAANGRYDLRLTAFAQESSTAALAAPVTIEGIEVVNGHFRVDVDLPLSGEAQVWLSVALRESGVGVFSPIPGRTKALAAPLIGACWSTIGDGGSDPQVNFIGTTDARPFVVRTGGAPSLRLEPSATTVAGLPINANVIAGSHANLADPGVQGAMIAGGGAPIGQGGPNRVSDHYGVVAGGLANQVGNASGDPGDAQFATVGGGWDNLARQVGATVAGGSINLADGDRATVGGGLGNSAMGTYATVAGGSFNRAEAMNAFVGGGAFNTASNTSFVGGGQNNTASGTLATVVGGLSNQASGNLSSVGGGTFNTASAPTSVVAGGGNNTASGGDAGILAGEGNQAVGTRSVVVGGYRSVAMARESTVSGGFENCAGAEFSWAGGHRAVARPGAGPPTFSACTLSSYPGGAGDRGTFVWADSGDDRFVSTGPNQFLVRAEGGAAINHNDPAGNALRVAGTLQVDALATEGVAPLCRNAAGRIAQCSSSGRYKTAIAELDLGLAAVKKLRAIAFTWTGSGAEDLGFVAEEIATLDERLITRNATGEIEGVRYERLTAVLAKAVQELSARESIVVESLARLEGENAALRAELVQRDAELRARLDALEARTPAH